jgi:cytochrome c oxidase subunit IV
MSGKPDRRIREMVKGPLLAWLALMGLLGATLAFAYVPMGAMNLAVSLSIAGIKTGIIALVFMELALASGLLRLAALLGLYWLTFLFLLMFADYLSR